ncbi:MAG: Hsp20/alpha crystallin family protein [Vicinamibacterales bacterium]
MARIFFDHRDAPGDLRRRFVRVELAPDEGADDRPPMDVLETDTGIEIVLDLPGIEPHAVSISAAHDTVVIAGTKGPTRCTGHVAFHLAERGFGRFRRTVTIGHAFDASRAQATLTAGELRIVLPRIEDRRGRSIPIRIDTR